MLTIYGSHLCIDCLKARTALEARSIPYTFVEFCESTANIKAFLSIRDARENAPIFDPVRASGSIGIPCFRLDNGKITLNLEDVLGEGR